MMIPDRSTSVSDSTSRPRRVSTSAASLGVTPARSTKSPSHSYEIFIGASFSGLYLPGLKSHSSGVPAAKPREAGFGPKPLKRRRTGNLVRQTVLRPSERQTKYCGGGVDEALHR